MQHAVGVAVAFPELVGEPPVGDFGGAVRGTPAAEVVGCSFGVEVDAVCGAEAVDGEGACPRYSDCAWGGVGGGGLL